MINAEQVQQYLLGPIVTQWFARFAAAERSKERFSVMAKLCRQFLGSSAKAMWEDAFRKEFYPQISQPQFMVSLNKAFELVAIIGPSLYWQNPVREVRTADRPDQASIAQVMGLNDEALLQQVQQQQQMEDQQRQLTNSLLTVVLDWIGREHPAGVKSDMELIIQEALVTGRGCGWTETYANRSTGEPMVGTFYDTVDNLLIDPDAQDPKLRDVRWMSRRHIEPAWMVERRFGYPPGYLEGRGTHVSAEWVAKSNAECTDHNKTMYNDMIEWHEIWSIGGIGARVTGVHGPLGQALDQLTGDYCYLCVTKNIPHPLNLPPILVNTGGPDAIREALRWRTARYGAVFELWRDRRWPCEMLDFYPVTKTCWPMAVLGPGIGSLLAMNILLASHLQLSWDRRRDIIAANGAYAAEVEAALNGEKNPAIIKINAASQMSVTDLVAFVQRPEVQGNLLEWIQYLDNQFQMATGLDDIHYGISQKQARVNSDVEARQKAANVRPEKMATDVHQFVVSTSRKEGWLAAMYMKGEQLRPLLGTWGSIAWDSMVASMTPDQLFREMDVFIEAIDMQRPNRDKDMSDMEKVMPYLLPVLQTYAQVTGDEKPLNAITARLGDIMQMKDVEQFFMGPWQPSADPAAQQMQQQLAALEAQRTQADIEETKAKTLGRLADAQYKQSGANAPTAQRMKWLELENTQKMRMQEEAHLQNLVHQQELLDIQTQAAKNAAKSGGK